MFSGYDYLDAYNYNIITESAKADKIMKKIEKKYGFMAAFGAKIGTSIKKYPAKSFFIGIASAIAETVIMFTCPVAFFCVYIFNFITFYIPIVNYIKFTITDKEYEKLCKELEKELDKNDASDDERNTAFEILETVKNAINKKIEKNKSYEEETDITLDLISCM